MANRDHPSLWMLWSLYMYKHILIPLCMTNNCSKLNTREFQYPIFTKLFKFHTLLKGLLPVIWPIRRKLSPHISQGSCCVSWHQNLLADSHGCLNITDRHFGLMGRSKCINLWFENSVKSYCWWLLRFSVSPWIDGEHRGSVDVMRRVGLQKVFLIKHGNVKCAAHMVMEQVGFGLYFIMTWKMTVTFWLCIMIF